jgi:mannose-1-phosphate guanylyltransferase
LRSKQRNIWAIVLAGGDGQRLSTLTRHANGVCTPKQYCSLNGGHSLLQLSLQRALAVTTRKHIVTVVTEVHRRWWEREFLRLSYSPLVVEPCNRGTGFGVLLPLLVIARSDPDAGVILIPSDHYVEHEDLLAEFLRHATAPETLEGDKLTLLGITPNAPDTGFGYLSPAPDSGIGMRPVHQFIEKPNETTAIELIRANSVWNSGIVAGRISQFLALYPQHTRQMVSDLTAIVEDWPDSRIPCSELAILYARHLALDFSHDVLEKCPDNLQFLTVPPCGWNDVGTPARLAQALGTARPFRTHATTSGQTLNVETAFDRFNLATKPPRAPSALINQPTFLKRGSAPWLAPADGSAHYDGK